MKKIIFIFIPSIILAIVVFLSLQVFLLKKFDKGALQVTSQPPSKVYLNGKYIGMTPLSKNKDEDRIPVGDYEIKLVPTDSSLAEFRDTITITKSALTVVDRKFDKGGFSEGSNISLLPIKDGKAAEILVVTIPDGVEVDLDDQMRGKTPLLIKDVSIAGHTLLLRKDGYKEKIIRVQTPPGHQLRAIAYLSVVNDISDISASASAKPNPATLPSTTPTPTSAAGQKVTILQTPNGFLRVRETPSTSGKEISRVNTGDVLDLISEQIGWYEVKLSDGTTGYISSEYAKKQ